jgi:hypothetical protein
MDDQSQAGAVLSEQISGAAVEQIEVVIGGVRSTRTEPQKT